MAANWICFRLLTHCTPLAAILAFVSAGNSMAARIAMIAMTTNSSIKVNPATSRVASVRVVFIIFICRSTVKNNLPNSCHSFR